MLVPEFGLNRFDWRSLDLFATDVQRAQDLGWDHALIPDSQLRRRDTYVMIAAAAQQTSRIGLGILLANPVNRHASVTASSIATVDELAPGRMLLAMGVWPFGPDGFAVGDIRNVANRAEAAARLKEEVWGYGS